jgi:hypothetical protein
MGGDEWQFWYGARIGSHLIIKRAIRDEDERDRFILAICIDCVCLLDSPRFD